MKKYLILLFLTLCFSNVNANSKEIELSNPKLLNYSCIGTYSTCFCKQSGGVFTKYIGDKIDTKNICGDGNELISYGKYLEFGGEPKHLSNGHQGGTDSSEAYNTYENFFLEFEPKTLKIFSRENNSTFLFCLYDDGQIKEFSSNSLSCGFYGEKISFKDYRDYRFGKKYRTILDSSTGRWEVYKNRRAVANGDMTKEEYDKRLEEFIKQKKKKTEMSNQASQKIEVVQAEGTLAQLDKKSLKEELLYWKELFQDELITQTEYDAKRKELLSGASVTTTTKVVEPKVEKKKVEKKKVVTQTTVVENNTNTIDLSFKDKNYINRSLLDKMGFFSNDGKIKDYCEDKYPKLHVYMECYAQNVKKYRNYKRAAAVYDLYIDYGRYLAWEAMIGNMSESSARYQLSAKRKELGDAYAADSRDKWNRIADSMEQLRKTHESFQPKPLYGSGESTNVCMYNAEEEAMKICRRKLNNGTCAQFSFEGC